MNKIISDRIAQSIAVKQRIFEDESLIETIGGISQACIFAFRNGKKILFAGNGGSAADAQHLAAEFSGRFYYDRQPLNSEALHVNTSYLTAVANDYSFEEVYARLIRAKGAEGDVFIALSTSGNSPNILRAIAEAKLLGMTVVGFTGESGGKMKDLCDFMVKIPSTDTPRIQESHILVGHIICELVEAKLFPL